VTKDWHLETQNSDYLDVSEKRLTEPPLMWVNQFTEIINSKFGTSQKIKVNDIGCNVGHFARNINELKSKVDYRGIDISDVYLNIARQKFPELRFENQDFSSKELNREKFKCDISIISATLEHIQNYKHFLKNIFSSTQKLILIRTFIGDESRKEYCQKENALKPYLIRQFKEEQLVNQVFNKDWAVEFHEDKATESKWKNICAEIRRRQIVIVYQLKMFFASIHFEINLVLSELRIIL
jgi:2-polyprenyl-3-methyl-5-hydroxy-6-metoxy-1,4-benzoquinol methylase